MTQEKNTLSIGCNKFLFHVLRIADAGELVVGYAEAADLKGSESLLERFLKCPSDGHGLAYRFHRNSERLIGAFKFLEGKPWYFDDTIIDGRLK